MAVGSKSIKSDLGTYSFSWISAKRVVNLSSHSTSLIEDCLSLFIPCSKQKSSQQPFPAWIPAWPIWIDIISLTLKL
ncbi:unnamed protein product [Blepharisma stoltei]|uniref:Uncharacterized protein n=1 Tax=Blepharisma stoltei TaxID=1481888 RepID=A0AAU9J7A6_9CILI|nr:unnamed protein product [Blepharisma stoltei]